MSKIKLGQTVYHEDVYDGKEPLKIVGIREKELELEGDYSGGTNAVIQKSWLPLEGVALNKIIVKNLQSINGYEIIDFMNTDEVGDALDDVSLSGPFEFVSQKIRNGAYELEFKSYFNNWGTDQDEYNTIYIKKDSIRVSCGEAHEGDGSEEELEEVLTKWIVSYRFDNDPESKFRNTMQEVYDRLPEISFVDKETLQELIDKLVKAKTYMK